MDELGVSDGTAVSAAQFASLFQSVSNWGRWGASDQLGALNLLTPPRVAAAAGLVRSGTVVSLSLPVSTTAGPACPEPAQVRLTQSVDDHDGLGAIGFAKDFVGFDYHGDGHTHVDALCHVAYEDKLYNGVPADAVDPGGSGADAIEAVNDRLVGRGVLLDVPGVRGVEWLEPGEHVYAEDLLAAEREQGVRFGEGDVLLVRTGHVRRLTQLGPWDTAERKAGLHPTAMSLLSERGVAVLGGDGNNDTAPSSTEDVPYPIHVLALNAMGVVLLDYLALEDLRDACATVGRWEFLFAAAPLRIPGGTGSPANPLAVL